MQVKAKLKAALCVKCALEAAELLLFGSPLSYFISTWPQESIKTQLSSGTAVYPVLVSTGLSVICRQGFWLNDIMNKSEYFG